MKNMFYSVESVSETTRKKENGGTKNVRLVTVAIPDSNLKPKAKKKKEKSWTASGLIESVKEAKRIALAVQPTTKKKAAAPKSDDTKAKGKPKK